MFARGAEVRHRVWQATCRQRGETVFGLGQLKVSDKSFEVDYLIYLILASESERRFQVTIISRLGLRRDAYLKEARLSQKLWGKCQRED